MKKKIIIASTMICLMGFIFATTIFTQAATTKQTIIGFTDMSASVEKSYGTLLELDLTLRNNKPVYKANVIMDGKRAVVYLDAITGLEIERKDAVALDEEEMEIYTNYNIAPSVSETSAQVQTISEATTQGQTSYTTNSQISYEEAKSIALAQVGGGTVREIDLDYENGILVYEVEIKYNGVKYEVDVNASTGKVVKYKSENGTKTSATQQSVTGTSSKVNANSTTAQITYAKAKEIALAKVGGGSIKEIELDYERGQLIYEVKVKYNGVEYDIDIDATTGEIVKYKIDD